MSNTSWVWYEVEHKEFSVREGHTFPTIHSWIPCNERFTICLNARYGMALMGVWVCPTGYIHGGNEKIRLFG